MVRCPKCGIKGDNYTIVEIIDREINGNVMIELNEVECDECHHHFVVKDVFKINYDYSTNVDFE